jgi:hypothetical protein
MLPQNTNHQRPIEISITMPATVATLKRFARPQSNIEALVARLAGVGRINLDDRHTGL